MWNPIFLSPTDRSSISTMPPLPGRSPEMLAAPRPHADELLVVRGGGERTNRDDMVKMEERSVRWPSAVADTTWMITCILWSAVTLSGRTPDSQSSEPGFEPPFGTVSKFGHFRSLRWRPCWLSCINEYLNVESGGNVSDLVLAHNCCLAGMLPGEAELVSEWTGLSGRAKSVKRFERSNATFFI